MAMTLDAIEVEVMNLTTADRSQLLDRLISSLDTDAELIAQWDRVAERRDAEIDSGQVQAIALDDALAPLYAKLQ